MSVCCVCKNTLLTAVATSALLFFFISVSWAGANFFFGYFVLVAKVTVACFVTVHLSFEHSSDCSGRIPTRAVLA